MKRIFNAMSDRAFSETYQNKKTAKLYLRSKYLRMGLSGLFKNSLFNSIVN